ncbi:uncharacterized protein J7T54_003722 [Emericellopsis cladophorae]|uniref:Uncharacterized protein n=1 Tax=Emericellopsis cladophorae TaxID=2686198 RepID=A0A9P9XY83_9HYPO|nr:uncharacterized protein J7T54_003722 [Emericellopsis cladophorae]KAI6779798.1 hypothetical protein J7T54_003722 [Emericellopsis cladophorae]
MKARLPSALRVNTSHPSVTKSLARLSREALLSLALDWLDEYAIQNSIPYLLPKRDEEDEDMDDLYPPCRSVNELRQLYVNMRQLKGSKRDVVSRITEGDWRHGLTLFQLAMADFAYLDEHQTSQRWSSYQILPLQPPTRSTDEEDEEVLKVDKESLRVPRFHPATFLQQLQDQILPDVKAHYHFHRTANLPVLLLRIFVVHFGVNDSNALQAKNSGQEEASFDGSKTSRNLWALLDKRGSGRTNASGGGWNIYVNEKEQKNPIDSILTLPSSSKNDSKGRKREWPLNQAQQEDKRAKVVAEARFGGSSTMDDGRGVERVEVVLQDTFPQQDLTGDLEDDVDGRSGDDPRRRSKVDTVLLQAQSTLDDEAADATASSTWAPPIKIAFTGSHVFAGIRQLVEAGIVDGERMPGWMTGEEGVTMGVVRHGRIRGFKGSGL